MLLWVKQTRQRLVRKSPKRIKTCALHPCENCHFKSKVETKNIVNIQQREGAITSWLWIQAWTKTRSSHLVLKTLLLCHYGKYIRAIVQQHQDWVLMSLQRGQTSVGQNSFQLHVMYTHYNSPTDVWRQIIRNCFFGEEKYIKKIK